MATQTRNDTAPLAGELKAEARIGKTSGVCGGEACVRSTRTPVWGLVLRRRAGLSDAEILARLPYLSAADLEAAWAYSERHTAEIEAAVRNNDSA